MVPLLTREGRLVLALEDSSHRAALEEVEFSANVKIVPVLARGRMIETVLHATYEQIVRPETVESLGKEAKRSSWLPSEVPGRTPMYGSRLEEARA